MISDNVLDQATEAFHAALDRHAPREIHGRDGHWVDGDVEAIVEALLVDGWQAPRTRAVSRSCRAQLSLVVNNGGG